MAGLVPNVGAQVMLKAGLNHTAPQNLVLKLFTNNYTPIETSVAGDFTEASGNGYAAKTLTGGSWSVTNADPSAASYAAQTFTFTGNLGNVYGYFLVQATSGILVAAERFDTAPVNVQNNGDAIVITPNITLD